MELWNLPAAGFNFLPDVSLLEDAAQYPNCDDRSDAATNMSAALNDTTHITATVAYYNGTTPGSMACFVCNNGNGFKPNTTTVERFCRSDALWSGSPIRCGMF